MKRRGENERKKRKPIDVLFIKMESFWESIKYTFKDLSRTKTTTVTSIIAISLAIFISSLILVINLNIKENMKALSSKIELKIYLTEDISEEDKEIIYNFLNNHNNVDYFTYQTKEEAFKELEKSFKGNEELLDGYNEQENPLVPSYNLKLKDYNMIDSFIKECNQLNGISDISNQKSLINNINKAFLIIELILIILLFIMSVYAFQNIYGIIKLSIHDKRNEIFIMKLVGATNKFIREPFIIKGLTLGIFGCIFGTILTIGIYVFANNTINSFFEFSLIRYSIIFPIIVIWNTIEGLLFTLLTTLISIKKYLSKETDDKK